MRAWIQHCVCALVLLGSLDFGNTQRSKGRNIAVNSEVKQSINFDCPEEFGYYPHPTDCTQYYVCVFGGALLESCTGGLMYSHELQTCDWPRNVGCDGLGDVTVTSPGGGISASVSPAVRAPEQRVRYTVVPTAVSPSHSSQPAAVVSSRGQSRQLQHSHTHSSLSHAQDIIAKQQQQQQLYADADDVLPPAEEIENDRQQRVYRGQPSTVGQVQRDRDGLRHTNAIPTSGRAEKIGVISFGTQQQQTQQQPVQQYRNDTFYFDDSLTNELTQKTRRKRHVKRRLPSIDLTTGDSSISWQSRHIPHLLYQPTKQTYQTNHESALNLQPPPVRFNPNSQQQLDYSAILSRDTVTNDQSEFQPYAPNPVSYKLQPVTPLHSVKTNPYIVPKSIKQQQDVFQYYNKPNGQNENYAYFNLGTVRKPATAVYAPSNQAKIVHAYHQANNPPQIQYYNKFRPITNAPSQVDYNNNHQLQNEPPQNEEITHTTPHNNERKKINQQIITETQQENQETESSEVEDEPDNEKIENNEDDSIKPDFPPPPTYFLKSTNKYEDIKNPFADPNFDFDKFITKLRGPQENFAPKQVITESKFQAVAAQNDSKQKLTTSKINPHVDLRTPVAFSSPSNKKKVNVKLPPVEDYYYDDDEEEEEIYEKPKKPQNYNIPVKSTAVQSNKNSTTTILRNINPPTIKKINPPVTDKNINSYKQLNNDKNKQIKKQPIQEENDEEYEYYDDYEYEDEKIEKPPTLQKPQLSTTTSTTTHSPKNSRINNKYENTHKLSNFSNYNSKTTNRPVQSKPNINQNKSESITTLKSLKYPEKTSEVRNSQNHKHPQSVGSTPRAIPVTVFKERQRLLTSTLRTNKDKDTTTTPRNLKTNSSRLEDSNVNTQSHQSHQSHSGTLQSTLSGRNLYNGSQHYDPTQYDPYYTLYEDDVELYRDVDYTPQQQYTTSNRAQASPQHTYRGTPAPISIKVQSAVQEQTVPQRNTAYYNTQQDVYGSAQDYQEDNYNTQVDDQTNYRQSSRQPSRSQTLRGDKNELSYYLESTPKSTTTIRTTTSTTTTPRVYPVQKQSVVPSRSSIIATANQTRPQSIIITLSATPGQKSSTPNPIVTSTTEKTLLNQTNTSSPKIPTRLITLSSGFSLRQTDNKQTIDLTPSTYKPHFVQSSSTLQSSDVSDDSDKPIAIIKPAPFSLTKLPDAETKSIIFRLSSRLTAKSNVSEASDGKLSLANTHSTETPNKREIISDSDKSANIPAKVTDHSHIVPTTYSPSKSLLASILPKHPVVSISNTENESLDKTIENKNVDSEVLVSIVPKKTVIVNDGPTNKLNPRKSISIENPSNERLRFDNDDKPVKTVIRKTPIKSEKRIVPDSEHTSSERKIISRIHFGFPQTYTNPAKINNLADAKTNIDTSSGSVELEESIENTQPLIISTSQRPVTAHYITTDLTTSQDLHSKFDINTPTTPSTESRGFVKYVPPNNSDRSLDYYSYNNKKESSEVSNDKTDYRFTYNNNNNFTLSTERGNSFKYTPPSTTTKYFEPQSHSSQLRTKVTTSTTEKYLEKDEVSQKAPLRFSFHSLPTVSTTTKYASNSRQKYYNYERVTSDNTKSSEIEDEPDIVAKTTAKYEFNSRQKYYNNDRPIIDSSKSSEIDDEPDIATKTTAKYEFNSRQKYYNNDRPIIDSSKSLEIEDEQDTVTKTTAKYEYHSRQKYNNNEKPIVNNNDSLEDDSKNVEHENTSKLSPVNDNNNDASTEYNKILRPQFRFSYNPSTTSTTEQEISSTTKKYVNNYESDGKESSFNYNTRQRMPVRFAFNPFTTTTTTTTTTTNDYESLSSSTTSSTTEKVRKPYFRFTYNAGPTSTSEVPFVSTEQIIPSSSESIEYNNKNNNNKQRFHSKFSFNNQNSRFSPSTTEKEIEQSRFIDNLSSTTLTYPSTTKGYHLETSSNIPKVVTEASTSTTTELLESRKRLENSPSFVSSNRAFDKYRFTEKSNDNLYINRNLDTSTIDSSISSTTELQEQRKRLENNPSFVSPNRAFDKYRFTERTIDNSLKTTSELPSSVSSSTKDEEKVNDKSIDVQTTYKQQKPTIDVTLKNNRTVVSDISRNITLPARLSRVNTAIKSLTAFGGTRRNSQTPKCNENQPTPDTKCNEIQKLRTTSTRGRGTAHYSNAGVGETVTVNRGTPATPRSRPTLKPSTSIVSKAAEFIDIYRYPPHRPDPIYPQPQVDKTAAKCRKDVCLLPDCSCGGKEIPGDLSVEQVPQIVLLTFDDSVNDLNKGLYSDLFEKGRTNPNGCPISATFYVSHEWTDYSQVQNLYSDGHEIASHTVSHSFGEQFSQKKWNREVAGQREILSAYGGVHLEDVRGMRAPFLSVGGNKMFKMLYDSNFTYDSSLPVYENRPPSWPYTLDYKLFHDCMIPPCPTRSYPGVWEVPMVMWQDLNGGRCSMGDACSNPPDADGVHKMIMKNFERHYTTNRAPFGLFYHAAWFTQPHHKEGFIRFLDYLVSKDDVYVVTNWQAIQWVRDPTPLNRMKSFQPFQCNYSDRPKRCNNPKVCNLWHKSGVRYMKTCQPCPDIYPWTGKTGIRSSRIDNDIED